MQKAKEVILKTNLFSNDCAEALCNSCVDAMNLIVIFLLDKNKIALILMPGHSLTKLLKIYTINFLFLQ